MMNGGYTLVDLGGCDLTKETTQTISGLFNRMKEAIKTGKPLIATNAVWGVNSNAPLTPIAFFAQEWSSTLIVGTASILNITVDNTDVVTITNLAS